MMSSKRGYIISYADWFKGFFVGLLVGAVIAYLFTHGLIKIPEGIFGSREAAKLALSIIGVV